MFGQLRRLVNDGDPLPRGKTCRPRPRSPPRVGRRTPGKDARAVEAPPPDPAATREDLHDDARAALGCSRDPLPRGKVRKGDGPAVSWQRSATPGGKDAARYLRAAGRDASPPGRGAGTDCPAFLTDGFARMARERPARRGPAAILPSGNDAGGEDGAPEPSPSSWGKARPLSHGPRPSAGQGRQRRRKRRSRPTGLRPLPEDAPAPGLFHRRRGRKRQEAVPTERPPGKSIRSASRGPGIIFRYASPGTSCRPGCRSRPHADSPCAPRGSGSPRSHRGIPPALPHPAARGRNPPRDNGTGTG